MANLASELLSVPLRRAILGGYRTGDVRLLASHWRAVLDRANERAHDLESEIRELRGRLDDFVAREAELNRALADVQQTAREIEERAEANARRIVQSAEERAADLRAEALTRVAGTGQQIDDLLRARQSLVANVREAVAELDAVLTRVDRGGRVRTEAAEAEPAPVVHDGRVFEQRLELDAGPFPDFAALSAFERTLARVANVTDVYVRRFANDRATVEVTLGAPTAFVGAMASALPYPVDVEQVGDERVSVTVRAPSTAPVS